MDNRSVLMILKTMGLEYDDRVRKECESLVRIGSDVKMLLLENSNKTETRTVWGVATAKSFSLLTRRLFPQARGLGFKVMEFTWRALVQMLRTKPAVVWAHNQEAAPLIATALLVRRLGWVDRVVWDQHELPVARVFEHRALRWLWTRLMRSCDAVIVANSQRREFIRKQLTGKQDVRFAVLENWADRTFRDLPTHPLPEDVRAWARGRPYVLLQGGAHPGRHFSEVVTAIIERLDTDIGVVVVGRRPEVLAASLHDRWGADFGDHVFFAGWVPQMEVPTYIDHAVASLVLYETRSENELFCAPNRLYQAIARGTPVVVGANPPMATLVSQHGVGVVLAGTGTSPDDIAGGIRTLLADPLRYREAIERVQDLLLWEKQEAEIVRVRGGRVEGWVTSEGSFALGEPPGSA